MVTNTIGVEMQVVGSPEVAAKLLAWHPNAFSRLSEKLGVSRQHVREVAYGNRTSPRVEKAIRRALGRAK